MQKKYFHRSTGTAVLSCYVFEGSSSQQSQGLFEKEEKQVSFTVTEIVREEGTSS